MKVSLKGSAHISLSGVNACDIAIIVSEGEGDQALAGQALCTVDELMSLSEICSAMVRLTNMAIEVLERKKKEARVKEHREALKALHTWSAGFLVPPARFEATDLKPGDVLMAPPVGDQVEVEVHAVKCTCQITAHGKVDDPECPECFAKENTQS